VQAPVGFWDPVGFTSDGDAVAFRRRHSTEIKHGCVSMLATMDYITPELTGKFPGYLSPSAGLKFVEVPNGLAAILPLLTSDGAVITTTRPNAEIADGFLRSIRRHRAGKPCRPFLRQISRSWGQGCRHSAIVLPSTLVPAVGCGLHLWIAVFGFAVPLVTWIVSTAKAAMTGSPVGYGDLEGKTD